MKAFKFSLEPLLTLRQQEEEKALEHYSTKARSKTQAELRIAHTEEQLHNLRAEYHSALGQRMAAGEMSQFAGYISKVTDRKLSEEAALKFCENELGSALQGVLKARQRKEALLNLKAKEECRFQEAVTRLEQRFIDELVACRASKAAAA